jgi:hypothetical protein
MSRPADVLAWLRSRTHARLKDVREAQTGFEVCHALLALAGRPDLEPLVTQGATVEDRIANYRIVKQLFEALGRPFGFDIDLLATQRGGEFMRLMAEVMALEDDSQRSADDDRVDALIAGLEADLEAKLQALTDLQAEMREVATERDFYFSKLLRIEKICRKYSPDDCEAVVSILKMAGAEFAPAAGGSE